MSKSPNTKNLWDWSLCAYGFDATRGACLELQDQFALDVNTLLWLCWCADNHKTPTSKALDLSGGISAYWQSELIAGVRKERNKLGKMPELPSHQNLKKAFLKLEILAEHRQQNQLETLTTFNQDPKKWTKRGLCQNNLDLFLAASLQETPACARSTERLCATIF